MKLSKMVKALRLTENSVLLIKNGSGLENEFESEELRNALAKIISSKIVIAFVDDLEDVRHLSEPEMNRFGWYRIEKIKRLFAKPQENKDNGNSKVG